MSRRVDFDGDKPILIVDQDSTLVAGIGLWLTFQGYVVQAASNGAEALQAFQRVRPGLVLLAPDLPVLDGFGFARALAAMGWHVPLILMIQAGDKSERTKELGAAAVLTKPFAMETLGSMLGPIERAA